MGTTDEIQQPVENSGCPFFEHTALSGVHALGLDYVITLFDQVKHLRDQLWWMLAIAIHRYDHIPTRRVQPGRQRSLVAKVTAQLDDMHITILPGQAVQQIGCPVR